MADVQYETCQTMSSRARASQEMSVDLRGLVNFHFHLEIVEFFFDLLSEKWRQAVAGCNVSSTIVLSTGPCLMKLNARTKDKSLCHHGLRRRR